jgi:pleiotropic regulator 1
MTAVASAVPATSDLQQETVDSSNALSNLPDLPSLIRKSVKRTRAMFQQSDLLDAPSVDASKVKLAAKLFDEYRDAQLLPAAISAQQTKSGPARPGASAAGPGAPKRKMIEGPQSATGSLIDDVAKQQRQAPD